MRLILLIFIILLLKSCSCRINNTDSGLRTDFIRKLITFAQYFFLFNDPEMQEQLEHCSPNSMFSPYKLYDDMWEILKNPESSSGKDLFSAPMSQPFGNVQNTDDDFENEFTSYFPKGIEEKGDDNSDSDEKGNGFGSGEDFGNGFGNGSGPGSGMWHKQRPGYGPGHGLDSSDESDESGKDGRNGHRPSHGSAYGSGSSDESGIEIISIETGDDKDRAKDLEEFANPFSENQSDIDEGTSIWDPFIANGMFGNRFPNGNANALLKNGRICWVCKQLVKQVRNIMKSGISEHDLKSDLKHLCDQYFFITSKEVCWKTIEVYWDEVYFIITHRSIPSRKLCGFVLQGYGCYKDFDDTTWQVLPPPRTKNNFVPCIPKNGFPKKGTVLKILHFSDIHLDINYLEGGKADCNEPQCCVEEDKSKSDSGKAGKYGDYRRCDLPMVTFLSALEYASKLPKIDQIIFTGGFAGHRWWEANKMTNRHIIKYIYKKFDDYFPDIDMQHATGSEDVVPAFMIPPVNMELMQASWNTRWMYRLTDFKSKDMCEKGRSAFGNDYPERGYYSCYYYENWNLRIISLNNNVCHVLNWWLLYSSKYIQHQLNWLVAVLATAEEKGQYVHIIARIPSGNSFCWKKWSWEYNNIIRRFSHIISAQFNGYTHEDEFNLYYNEKSEPINVAWNGGSLTPYTGYNPSFKIYFVNTLNYRVEDVEVYSLNLTEANSAGKAKWDLLYNFKDTWKIKDLKDYDQLHQLVRKIAHSEKYGKRYHKLKGRLSEYHLKKNKCGKNCLTANACKIVASEVFRYNEYVNCLQNKNSYIPERRKQVTGSKRIMPKPKNCPIMVYENLYLK